MKRKLPFDINKRKREYLLRIAAEKMCIGCDFVGSHECGLIVENEKRTMVDDIQDCFEVTYKCPIGAHKCTKIEKFFSPNKIFKEKYFEEIHKISQSQMTIEGAKVLESLLLFGRLQIDPK